MKDSFQPVIIIGAARSGTNMLRDILVNLPNCATWDCDEINPIWRHGNLYHPDDQFSRDMASESTSKFIRKQFLKIAKVNTAQIVIEKTCANSLRIPFIKKVLPEAKFIFIIRDPRDAVSSSMIQYKSPFDLKYTLKKLRYTPLTDIFFYLKRFGINRVRRTIKKEENLKFWGVQFKDMQNWGRNKNLHQICAKQWLECVNNSIDDLKVLDKSQYLELSYEEFVNAPLNFTREIADFIGVDIDSENLKLNDKLKHVSKKSIGKYKDNLTSDQLSDVEEIVFSKNERYSDKYKSN